MGRLEPMQTQSHSSSELQNQHVFSFPRLRIMKEYRRVDDSITMRLNRNSAQWRDKHRMSGKSASNQEAACESFWRELVANWKARKALIDYCIGVVDGAVNEKTQGLDSTSTPDAKERGTLRAAITSDQVKKKQINQELSVELIIRRRSLEAFAARCKYFEPPLTDVDGRKWWDAAAAGQHVE